MQREDSYTYQQMTLLPDY